MSPEISSEPKSKRRRIMVISGDDSVTDQIEKMNDISLCQSILLDTLDGDIAVSHLTIETTNPKKSKDSSLTCVICESSANGYNFDVISCEICKSLYRRNAVRTRPLKCPHQGTCDVTVKSRHRCSACRLTQCFNKRMRCERIQIAEQKSEIDRHQRENKPSLPTLFAEDV